MVAGLKEGTHNEKEEKDPQNHMLTPVFNKQRVTLPVAAAPASPAPSLELLPTSGPRFAGKRWVVAFMVAKRDFMLLWDLVAWMRELEGQRIEADVVVTCEHDLDPDLTWALVRHCDQTFAGRVWSNRAPFQLADETWPLGPDWLFACTAEWCHRWESDFLLLEPDVTVLKPNWCDTLRRAYYGGGRPFMGTWEAAGSAHPEHMPGNGVYPWNARQYLSLKRLEIPFDVWLAERGVMRDNLVTVTPLIQQVWCVRDFQERQGKNGGMAVPSRQPGSVIAALTFPDWETVEQVVSPAAMVFHRCKDGSLIQRLRERRRLTCTP